MSAESPFAYDGAGLFLCEGAWIHPTRSTRTYEILLVVTGDVYLREEDMRLTLRPGDAMLLRPHVEHGGWRESEGETSFYWAHFQTQRFEALGLRPGAWCVKDDSAVVLAFKRLLHMRGAPGYPPYALDAAMGVLLAEASANQRAVGAREPGPALQAAEWIRINAEQKLTAQLVARKFSYNGDYLCALFRKHFGVTLKQYIAAERVARVKHYLLAGGLSMKEVARALHFDNENQLAHYFKYHEGISPARYRDQYAHTHMNNR